MLDNLFIAIGNIVFLIYNSIVHFNLPEFSKNEDSGFLKQFRGEYKNDENKFRAIFLKYFLKKQIIAIFILIALFLLVFAGIELAGIFLIAIGMLYIFMLHYPCIAQRRSYADLNRELPYALRHMGIELKSGKGLHDSLRTVANAGYGSFSSELTRVLEEIRYGQSTENALLEMSDRVNSSGLSRCVQQLIGTLRVGGNLANSLEIIAEDISFEMHIKLKDYSQRLNAFILIYTFLAILAPVILLIMLMAASTVMGDIIPADLIMILYSVLFPMVVVFMGVLIKRLEPEI